MAFPPIGACIVCEGVRPELYGKHLLLGFFGVAPYTKITLLDVTKPATLVFVFSGGAGEGDFGVDMRITDAEGNLIHNPSGGIPHMKLSIDKNLTNIYMGFNGTFGKAGRYRVSLVVDGTEHYVTTVDIDGRRETVGRVQ